MMRKNKIRFASVLEGFAYSLCGTIYVLGLILIEEFLIGYFKEPSAISFATPGYVSRFPALGWMLIGFCLAFVIVETFLKRRIKSVFLQWATMQLTAAVLSISAQTVFLILYYGRTPYWSPLASQSALEWAIELFFLLTPFTIVFAFVVEFVKNRSSRNSLK